MSTADALQHVQDAMADVVTLTESLAAAVKVFETATDEYVEAAIAERKTGARIPRYCGTPASLALQKLVPAITAAAQKVGFVDAQVRRLTGNGY